MRSHSGANCLSDLSPTMSIAILFLAHDGVANPELWEEWRGNDRRIHFVVVCNAQPRYDNPFTRTHDAGIRIPTRWGTRSLVDAALAGMRYCMERDPSIGVVYMVCGLTVPLKSPSSFFRQHACMSGEVFRPFTSNIQIGEGDAVRLSRGQLFRPHSQFIALTRRHIDHLRRHHDRLEAMIRGVEEHGMNPDEWIFARYFSTFRLKNMDYPLMDRTIARHGETSPIVWTDTTTANAFVWDDGPLVSSTLLPVLQMARRSGCYFFRKAIVPTLRFHDVTALDHIPDDDLIELTP